MQGQLWFVELDENWLAFDASHYYLVSAPPPGFQRAPEGWVTPEVIDRVRATAQLDGLGVTAAPAAQPSPSGSSVALSAPPDTSVAPSMVAPPPATPADSKGAGSLAGRLWESSKRKASAGAAMATDPAVRQRAAEAAVAAKAAASKATERATQKASSHVDRARGASSAVAHAAKDATVATADKVQPVAHKAGRASLDAAAVGKRAAVAAGSATGAAVSSGAAKVATATEDVMAVRSGTKQALAEDPEAFARAGGRHPRTAWLLWLFLGSAGGHRFYAKSMKSGMLRLVIFLVALSVALGALAYGVSRVLAVRENAEFENLGDVLQVIYLTTRMPSIWHTVSSVATVCAAVVGILWLIDASLMSGWLIRRNRKALVSLGRHGSDPAAHAHVVVGAAIAAPKRASAGAGSPASEPPSNEAPVDR